MAKAREIKEIIKDVHPEYAANINDWLLYGDAVDGSGGFKNGSYLTQFTKESEDNYTRRQGMADYSNHTAPVIDTYTGHLYKKPITREYDKNKELERFYASTNIEGNKDINELVQEAFATALTYGHCFAVIDRSWTIEEMKTKADENAAGVKTYAYIITPKAVINWGLGEDGLFNWVIIKETVRTNEDDWKLEHEMKTRYRVWTRDYWAVYNEDENAPAEEGTHTLGVVPVIPIYNVMGEGRTIIGRSAMQS